MVENEKSSFIASSFSLLLKVWEIWDVKAMVLFSLTLQIILSVLGRRRKYKINYFFKAILRFAYLGADWIAIATLGKLSSSYAESTTSNVFRAYWAPLLLVHLGGPDTITAYAFEDNKDWINHLVTLVVKVIFVIYVVYLSWTFSWLSFFSLPLILAGIIKYVEKIWCLELNNSQKTKPIISSMFNLRGHSDLNENQALDRLRKENPNILAGYLFFTIMRPDVNDYLSSQNLSDIGTRIKAHLGETTGIDGTSALDFVCQYLDIALEPKAEAKTDVFEGFSIQLGFMFDVVYTKASLIYTKLGCFLRLTSFTSCFSVLLLFFINIVNEPKFHGSRIDIAITSILLSGAIAQELYAAWVMLSSDWAVLVAEFHRNVLVRKMFKVTLKYFPCLLHQSKKLSNQMGQFDLLEYCWRYKKRKANQSQGFLPKTTTGSEIAEIWHKYWFTKFVDVPPSDLQHLIAANLDNPLKTTRGENALQEYNQLKWSIEMKFDHSIIIWHLATSVLYLQEDNHDDEVMKTSKHVSDYMMYLLAMCPALLLSEHSKSIRLDRASDDLKELVSPATNIRNAASTLLESREKTFDSIGTQVSKLATFLRQSDNKWEVIRDVWLEMLFHAAVSSHHTNHVKQLGEGIEFLSLIWLFVGGIDIIGTLFSHVV